MPRDPGTGGSAAGVSVSIWVMRHARESSPEGYRRDAAGIRPPVRVIAVGVRVPAAAGRQRHPPLRVTAIRVSARSVPSNGGYALSGPGSITVNTTFLGLRFQEGSRGGRALNDTSEDQSLALSACTPRHGGRIRDRRRLLRRRGPLRRGPCSAERRPRQGSRVHGAPASEAGRDAGARGLPGAGSGQPVRQAPQGPQGVPGPHGRSWIDRRAGTRGRDGADGLRVEIGRRRRRGRTRRSARADADRRSARARVGLRARPAHRGCGAAGPLAHRNRRAAGPQGAAGAHQARRARRGERRSRCLPEHKARPAPPELDRPAGATGCGRDHKVYHKA